MRSRAILFALLAVVAGDPGTQLEGYMNGTETVPPETMRDSVDPSFNLPPAQQARTTTFGGGG